MAYDKQKANRIWRTVCKVPAGKVASYGQIADLAGLPGRARLVGKALGYAPKNLKVPWYRILRSSGQLAFTAGSQEAERQKGLLQEEGVVVLNNRVKLKQFGWQPELGELLDMEY
ncbi:MGMT family protein [Aliikangiella coralliicola]|uniref:MGMT family protein n=1 Tax=Aliikangiella coralliicola TaxID=2592383 RepID=A0A545U7D7_9GAMM|nr:MGMT family protein [Aliikangiella coralliicola]TQV85374.1 MGMT family protein [Aliikangiella coralliicola]